MCRFSAVCCHWLVLCRIPHLLRETFNFTFFIPEALELHPIHRHGHQFARTYGRWFGYALDRTCIRDMFFIGCLGCNKHLGAFGICFRCTPLDFHMQDFYCFEAATENLDPPSPSKSAVALPRNPSMSSRKNQGNSLKMRRQGKLELAKSKQRYFD